MSDFADSIAAIATAPGRGGIAIIRISGPGALYAASQITGKWADSVPDAARDGSTPDAARDGSAHASCAAASAPAGEAGAGTAQSTFSISRGDCAASDTGTAACSGGACAVSAGGADSARAATERQVYPFRPRYAYFCKFYDGDEVIDEGVLLYFKAPHSYTGEDVIELQGHGGNVAPQRVLSAVLKIRGVRQAEPGEFTRRAFLNGRMDLTAAEAVEDLISAGSESAARAALASLSGVFARRLDELTQRLTTFRVRIEACLDFPEEHEDFFDSGKAGDELTALLGLARDAQSIAAQGVKLNEGARIVLAGQPNAGKSSLLNALAGADRAIVTNIPGTTRDVLTVNIEIGGIPVTITDTAGIRDTPSDEIEAIGIQRALDELRQADLILLMIDSSRPALDAIEALNHIKKVFDNPRNLIVVKSKQDLPADEQTAKLLSSEPLNQYPQLSTSTKTADGLEQLRSRLQEALGIIPTEGVFSARRRHLGELDECYQAIERACGMLELGDLVLTAREITLAQNHLGTITGKVTSDDILGIIFSTFCIGK